MRDNLTDIIIVLDRSGSMEAVADDTIGGFNRFLLDQKQAAGEAILTLVQFDHEYEVMHAAKRLNEVPALSRETFVPRGNTALLDAIGRTINATIDRLAKTDESKLPGTVIFVILTDGHENASHEFTRDVVFKLIKEKQEKRKWQFVFLGANQDAIEEGGKYGIARGYSLSCAANGAGSAAAFKSLSSYIGRARSGYVGNSFQDADRDEQKKHGAK
jgi:Mg-chelatase subunit ChlD